MSGWDVSSTPTWGPQDGPEDTQASPGQEFGNQDFGHGGPGSPAGGFPEFGGGFSGEGQAGGPPAEFFGQDNDPGRGGYPKRTPGRSFQDLPRRDPRGRHSSAPGGGYGEENGFGQDAGFGQENGYGPGDGFGQQGGYGQDGGFGQQGGGGFGRDGGPGFGQESGFGPEGGPGFGQENGFGHDAGYGQNWGGGGQAGDTWQPGGQENDGWGKAAGRSAAPWDERPQPDAGYPGPDGQEFGQHEFGQDYPRQGPGFAPGFTPQDYDGQDFPGQDAQGFGRGDTAAARNDPALQDFFAPQRGGTGAYPGQGPGRPGDPRNPGERFRAPADGGWDDPGGRPPGPRTGTGPRPMPRGPRLDDPEPRRGLGTKGLVAIGAVVAIVVAGGAYLVFHKSGSGTPTASNSMSTGTTPAAKPSATKSTGTGTGAGTGAAATAFTLSTPATAGGYPKGQDPQFLAAATTTAKAVTTAITAGGGGTVKGAAVSAAYTLPASQVITFVGYTGTFTPTKVETILASLGSDPHTYPAGANGGVLGCANTTTAPDGALCVWTTTSTLGITEFFSATGPETLNAAQAKGAADTLKLRNSVETKQ